MPPSPDALPADDPRIALKIRTEIQRHGRITFARFMEIVLYDPEAGYYAGAAPRAGRSGDFLTAAESHPLFGRALARLIADVAARLDEPEGIVVREHGAGSGALAVAILDGLVREAPDLARTVRYEPVETTPARLGAVVERLRRAGHGDRLRSPGGPVRGVILANELLDALPAHRVVGGADGGLQELYVGLDADGRLIDVAGEPSTPRLAERLAKEGVRLAEGQRGEINLALEPWIVDAAAGLERGVLLLIDYGYAARALYDAGERPAGTLRAYVQHAVHADPYRHLGRQDLTTHVDLSAVDRAARAAGLGSLGTTTQAELLVRLDVGQLLADFEADERTDLQAALEARAALKRMLDPRVTGRFAVLAYGRDLSPEPPIRGFERG